MNLHVLTSSSQCIHTLVLYEDWRLHISFAYVKPNLVAKEHFWREYKDYLETFDDPWVLLGDLNYIGALDEQWGSERVNASMIDRFVLAYGGCDLIDMDSARPRFT